MQIGCGFRIKEIKGRDYVYFWHYEDRGGRSRQVYQYMGPRRSSNTARRLAGALDSYFAGKGDELPRQHVANRAAIAALRSRPISAAGPRVPSILGLGLVCAGLRSRGPLWGRVAR